MGRKYLIPGGATTLDIPGAYTPLLTAGKVKSLSKIYYYLIDDTNKQDRK